MDGIFFKDLTPAEERKFRRWARENYKALSEINGVWHPVVQDECRKINEEANVANPTPASFGDMPAYLAKMAKTVIATADLTLRKHGTVPPIWHFMTSDENCAIFPTAWGNDMEKQLAIAAAAEVVQLTGAIGYLLVQENWTAQLKPGEQPPYVRARERADRQEAITLTAVDKATRKKWLLMGDIQRDEKGARLGSVRLMEGEFDSVFASLFEMPEPALEEGTDGDQISPTILV